MRLLIIGGLGDHDTAMRLSLPLWRLRGFTPTYWPIGWNTDDGKFDERFARLMAYVDALPAKQRVSIIGTSAGGIVAVLLLLARPRRVAKVIAVSSPLVRERHSTNGLLNAGLARLSVALKAADVATIARIGSFYGMKDSIVDPSYSKLPGALHVRLPASGHMLTIALALSLWSGRLAKWLR